MDSSTIVLKRMTHLPQHRGNIILKLISFVLLVICCIAIVFIAYAVFKLLAIALMVWFVLWLCWQSLKELFTEEDKPP